MSVLLFGSFFYIVRKGENKRQTNLYSIPETKKITSTGGKLETETGEKKEKKRNGKRKQEKTVRRAFHGRRSVGDKTKLLFFPANNYKPLLLPAKLLPLCQELDTTIKVIRGMSNAL